jgi:cytidine deaminase
MTINDVMNPYSYLTSLDISLQVGCAIVCADGTVYGGSNIENAAYPIGICAERSALTYAVGQGHRKFKAIVVSTRDGGSCCGACRQFIREFVHPKDECPIIFTNDKGEVTTRTSIEGILPFSFGPENLDT